MGPPVVLGPHPWSHGLRVKEALWSHPLPWARSHAWCADHDDVGPPLVSAPTHDGPARSDGAEGTGQASAREECSRNVTVARPSVVVAPLTGSWEGTVAGQHTSPLLT